MAARAARPGLQVRAGERRGHDPQRSADQHSFRSAAAPWQCLSVWIIPPHAKHGEVARRARGVMNDATDAHGPSARSAGTSPPAVGRQRYLTSEQARELGRKSNLIGALLVLHAWALIGASMALFAWWPNPFTFLLGVMVVGGRQLG